MTGNMVSFKEVWLLNKFKRIVVFSTIRLEGEVISSLESFWKFFIYLVPLLL